MVVVKKVVVERIRRKKNEYTPKVFRRYSGLNYIGHHFQRNNDSFRVNNRCAKVLEKRHFVPINTSYIEDWQ